MKYKGLLIVLFFSCAVYSFAQIAKCKGKYFGNVIGSSVPTTYSELWNQVTPENGTKWGVVEATKGEYDWTEADLCYNWAKENNALFKFHTFVWGSQMPDWVDSATTEELTESIENFMIAAAEHFEPMGGLDFIDVLNEPANPVLPDYMTEALTAGYQSEPANADDLDNEYGWAIWPYQLARKYFPDAILITNEYNIEEDWDGMRAPYIEVINAIKAGKNLTDGSQNLIDGLGLQCHGVHQLTADNFLACLDEMWEGTGLPIHITEFDQWADPDEAKQEEVYSSLITVAWEHEHVAGITLWGYIQGQTWLPGNGEIGPDGTDSGIQYDSTYTDDPYGDRPALTWLKEYMDSQEDLYCCPDPAPFATCNPPVITITEPENASLVGTTETVSLTAKASVEKGSIESVVFYSGSTIMGTASVTSTSTYVFKWKTPAVGTYSISAVATDSYGIQTISDTIEVVVGEPEYYIYECDGCASDSWTTAENWTPASIPTAIDTALIRTGEVKIYTDKSTWVRVEPDGIFRMIGNYTVPNIELQGGTLKVYTSNSGYGLTSNVDVQEPSTIWGGSQTYSVFWFEGSLSGDGDLTKTYTGILDLNLDASEYTGDWYISEGTFRIANATSIGENTVTLSDSTIIDIAAEDVYIFNVVLGNATLNLDYGLEVKKFSIADSVLEPGTYTATDFPDAITGTDTLIVLGNPDCTGLEDGTAYYDNCGTCVSGTTGLEACASSVLEAEDICEYDGVLEATNLGFQGTGYVNTPNELDVQVTFYATAGETETVYFYMQYANGGSSDRNIRILVNDIVIDSSFSMPSTGAWTTYLITETEIPLEAGANKIEFIANTSDGIANLDYFEMYSYTTVFTGCLQDQEIQLYEGWNLISTNLYPYVDSLGKEESALISNVFYGLDVSEIKTLDNYWLNNQNEVFNSLETIEPAKGYLVYMNTDTALTITGMPMMADNYVFILKTGWNLIGCPYDADTDFSTLFDDTDCVEIKDFEGSWLPDDSTGTIQNMEPGKAYFLKK